MAFGFIRRLIKSKIDRTKDQIRDWQDPDREENPMPCLEITLEGIDKELHSKFIYETAQAGAHYDGNQVTLHGITLAWNYDEPSKTLHVTALKHPFYFSCGEIENKIRELVAKAKGSL